MASRRRASRSSITGTLTDLQRRVKYLQNKQTPTKLGNQSVVRSAIQPRAVDSDQLALDSVTNDQIEADAVKREQIDVAAVGTTELDNLAVTNSKLGAFAVTTDKIGDEQVDNRTLGPLAVTNAKLQDAAVELRNMTPNSVENTNLITDSVNFRTLDIDAVGNENMLGDSVGNAEMRDDSIGNAELQNGAVGQSNLQSDSVGFGELQGNSVGNSTLQNGSVTDSKFGGSLSGSKVGSGINGANLNNRSVTSNKIADNSLGDGQISNSYPGFAVSRGLETGYGINKSGNRISIDTRVVSPPSHRHSYTYSYFTDTTSPTVGLTGFTTRTRISASASSLRFKKEISEHETADPKKLLDLKFKKYKYKRRHSDAHNYANKEWMHGYIAEELEEMGFSEVLHYDAEGVPEKIDYGLFSALVLELVKVQQQEIEYLKNKVDEMDKK